ncbi:unnamed protein product [Effrenium voratum]|nr:unnamed protein product [Effrenium voratum]
MPFLADVTRQGSRKVVLDGKHFASFGMMPHATEPTKVAAFNPRKGEAPEKVDLRPYMTTVEDQSQTNSCCANAVAGAYEYINKRHAMQTGEKTEDVSRLFIYFVGRKKDQQMFREDTAIAPKDEGMSLGGAISALQLKGACMESNWPFALDRVNEKPSDSCFSEAMRYKISESRKVPVDLETMRKCLAEGHPIVFGLKLTAQFFKPLRGGGIVTPDPGDPQSSKHGLHAMLIVGYNNRQKVFIVRNSWGTSWGDRGYGYVPYDYICNEDFNCLGQYAIVGLTDADFMPEPDDGRDYHFEEADAASAGNTPCIDEYEDEIEDDAACTFDPEHEFDTKKEAMRAFQQFDLNHNGLISAGELNMCLLYNGIKIAPQQLQQMFAEFDLDHSKSLDFDEFWNVMRKVQVGRFAKTAAVTEANLIRLERRLHGRANKRIPDENQSVISGVSNYSGMSRARSATSLVGREMVGSKFELPSSYDWTRLDEYASYLHEQDALRQQLGVKALQRKMRMDLDHQVAEKVKKKVDAVEEDKRYYENSLMEMERWKEQEQLRQEEKHHRVMKEKLDRDAQLEYEQKLKADELQKKKDEESSLVEKIVNEMETEQRRYEKKKEQTKRAMRKVFQENMEDQRRRDIAKKEATEKEAETMKEYNRILDEQEEQRAQELAARMERQSELMKKLQENVDSVKKGAGDNDAQRAMLQAEEQDRHYFEAESVKQGRLAQMRQENQAYLLKQMEEKDSRKNEEKYLQHIQAQILERDAEEYNAIEKQKIVDRKLRNLEHRKDIEKQMEWKTRQAVPEMSEAEIQLNRPLLELVERTLHTRDENTKRPKEAAIPEEDDEDL